MENNKALYMNVLHIAEKSEGGGAESVFRETILLLKNSDLTRTHYVACKKSDSTPFKIDFVFSEAKGNSLDLIYSRKYKRELDSYLTMLKPEIIHLHHYANLSASILHSLYTYKNECPTVKIVQTVHTFEYACSHHAGYDYNKSLRCLDCAGQSIKTKIFYRNCSRSGYLHGVGKGINSLITHYFYRKRIIDIILTPSLFMKETIALNKFYNNNGIIVVDNPVSGSFTTNREGYPKKEQIIYFGRLSEEKNLEILIKAFSHYIKNDGGTFSLLIVGEGPDRDKLWKLVSLHDLQDKVDFLPFMPHASLKIHLENSKISVLPSKCFENAPMMVIESLGFNIVPIVCNHGGMKEMIAKFNFGLVFESDNYLSLANQISYAVSNYEKLTANVDDNKQAAKKSLSSEHYISRLDQVYQQTINI